MEEVQPPRHTAQPGFCPAAFTREQRQTTAEIPGRKELEKLRRETLGLHRFLYRSQKSQKQEIIRLAARLPAQIWAGRAIFRCQNQPAPQRATVHLWVHSARRRACRFAGWMLADDILLSNPHPPCVHSTKKAMLPQSTRRTSPTCIKTPQKPGFVPRVEESVGKPRKQARVAFYI